MTGVQTCALPIFSPDLLAKLAASTEPVTKKLDAEAAKKLDIAKTPMDEKTFRFSYNEDPMAVEKTADGIRKFSADIVKLEKLVASKLG